MVISNIDGTLDIFGLGRSLTKLALTKLGLLDTSLAHVESDETGIQTFQRLTEVH